MGRGWWCKTCGVLFEKEVNFHIFDFEIWGLEIKYLKAHNFVWQGHFFFHYYLNFDDRLSSNVHRFVIWCTCWDTAIEKTGLWQLPIVSTVFNYSWDGYFKLNKILCIPAVVTLLLDFSNGQVDLISCDSIEMSFFPRSSTDCRKRNHQNGVKLCWNSNSHITF